MSQAIGIFSSIGQIISMILIAYGGMIALTGWYEDRPDNVTRGIWILGTGAAIAALLIIVPSLFPITEGVAQETKFPTMPKTYNMTEFNNYLKDQGVKLGNVAKFGLWFVYILVAVMFNIASLTAYVIKFVGSQFAVIDASTGNVVITGFTIAMAGLVSIAQSLYVFFAMHEISNQYKRISSMGGSDLSSFGIPIQLVLRLAIPLAFLSIPILTSIYRGTASLSSQAIDAIVQTSSVAMAAESDPLTIATEMAKSMQGMPLFSELLFSALCLLNFFIGMFSIGKIAAIGISISIRLIGYGVALPVGIASFASEDYQDMGKSMIKGFLGAAMQGAFVILSIQLTLVLTNVFLRGLFGGGGYAFSNIQIAVAIISAGILAAAEEGFNLSKELFR